MMNTNNIFTVLEDFQPDIILLDVNLGSVDGREICKAVKQSEDFGHIPILLMTAGFIRYEDSNYGAASIIEKPFDMEDIRAKVKMLS